MLRQSTSLPARIAARKNFPGLQVHASSTINYNADDLKDSNSKPKAILYQILALGLAGAGIGLLAYPSKAIELGFSATPTLLIQGLVRILGSVHIIAAISANSLASAASHARLSSDTYKRLNLGLTTWGAASLAVFLNAPVVATFNAQVAYGSLLGLSAVLPLLLNNGLFASLPPPRRFWPLFKAERLYDMSSSAVLVFILASIYAYFNPGVLNTTWLAAPLGALGTAVLRLLASGGLLAYFVLTALEDAAHRGRLGASTFKALNYGVAIVSGTILAVSQVGYNKGLLKFWPALPQTVTELSARWVDVYSEYAFALVGALGLFSLFFALFAKKK